MQNMFNQDSLLILLAVLLIGVIIGAKIGFEFSKSFFLFQRPPYQPLYQQPYQQPYSPYQMEPHEKRGGNLLGTVLLLLVLASILLAVARMLSPNSKQDLKTTNTLFKTSILSTQSDAPAPTEVIGDNIPSFVKRTTSPSSSGTLHGVESPVTVKTTKPYVIEIGMFTDIDRVQHKVSELENFGLPVDYHTVSKEDKVFYVVYIGPYQAKDIAVFVKQEMKLSSGKIKPMYPQK